MSIEIPLPELRDALIFIGGAVSGIIAGAAAVFCFLFKNWEPPRW